MERAWPYDLDCCKVCDKPPAEVEYKARGLCVACFKRVQYRGNLRDYFRYPEDRMRSFDGRRTASREIADLVYCVRNVGVEEVAECLGVAGNDVRAWLESNVPILHRDNLCVMRTAIQEEVYEFRYPKYEVDPWGARGDNFYGTTF